MKKTIGHFETGHEILQQKQFKILMLIQNLPAHTVIIHRQEKEKVHEFQTDMLL